MEALEQFFATYGSMSTKEARSLIANDAGFRQQLESLYRATFKKRLNKGCSNCWLDAYILLLRTEKNRLKAMKDCKFELKAGALLVDVVNGDNAKMATRHNLTDELALYHLRTNPKCIRLFSKYPDDWQAQAEESAPKAESKAKAKKKAKK